MDTKIEDQEDMERPTALPKFQSRLMPPSKTNPLSELSDMATNARPEMPPPSGIPTKHKPPGRELTTSSKREQLVTCAVYEPVPKIRKTLAEQAGESYGSKMAAPRVKTEPANGIKTEPTGGSRLYQPSSSLSRVPPQKASKAKPTAANKFGGSVGYGARATSANSVSGRPKSAYGGHNRSKSAYQAARPATSNAQHGVEADSEPKAFFDDSRMAAIEAQFETFRENIQDDLSRMKDLKATNELTESRNVELEATCARYRARLDEEETNVKDLKSLLSTTNMELESVRRSHSFEVDDLRRKHRNQVEDLEDRHRKDSERSRRDNEGAADKVRKELEARIEKLLKAHADELADLERRLKTELEEERSKRVRDTTEVQAEFALKLRQASLEADTKEREAQLIQGELTNTKAELDRERSLKVALQGQLTQATTQNLTLEASNKAMLEKINFLESDSQAQSSAFNELHRRMQDAIEAAELANEKLRQEETLRRKLHNQVQELKGNIRVMCRVRPPHDSESDPANIGFPDSDTDSKEVAVQGPEKTSAMGANITQTHSYAFDRVFSPASQNGEVFEEISQLVQSALDGYNVCIFCYGQTGSGKTFTMSSTDGMIPRATAQIYSEATRLEEKGWRYKMEGSFVEVYNETYNDLLGRAEDLDKKKLEVRHDPTKKQTMLENAVSVELDGPDRVEEIMERASKNRSVAATKANMRSSRSHSVFILKLVGENSITGEKSQGTLNLVDLAGSERLEHSKAEGARLKETQNINKSLSCLGDVINALGSGKDGAHIPYRNSKLTYLLQYSLGGNSKTLMFVMVSPLQAHLQETITSLKFATKVNNTHIGTAKRQTKASGANPRTAI